MVALRSGQRLPWRPVRHCERASVQRAGKARAAWGLNSGQSVPMLTSRCLSTYCVLGRASTRETHFALRVGDVRGVDSMGWCHGAESKDNPPKTSDDVNRVGRACRGGELPWKGNGAVWESGMGSWS